MTETKHIWNFSTVGGVKRVNLESGSDLLHLNQLDQKLWTALSCPAHSLEIDKQTLELIDTDKDGYIRVPEILNAVAWACNILNNPNELLLEEPVLKLSSINTKTEEGKALHASAKIILAYLNKREADSLTTSDTSDTQKIFASSKFNGDGIISENSLETDSEIKLLNTIIELCGSVSDRSGLPGVSLDTYTKFIDSCNDFFNWHKKKEENYELIMPFGTNTERAYFLFNTLKLKIDDYFLRCKLADFDPETTTILNGLVARIEQISSNNLSECIQEIATYPLAKIEANKNLPLTSGINPAWEKEFKEFSSLVINVKKPNSTNISENDWLEISSSFEAYQQWQIEKAGQLVESLGIDNVKSILTGEEKNKLTALIEEDKKLETQANNIILVDKLVRYHRDLFKLLKNFVTFYDFYSPSRPAIFQAGTLYIDQRSCDLCIRVNDMGKHNTMASFSGMFLMYCDCTNKSTNEKMTIVAALTNGDVDNLVVGRNALFYDRNGLDWDATITKIIDNPISIRQAFWSPYRKISRFIETQINKVAAAQENKVTENATKSIEEVPITSEAVNTAAAQPKAPPVPFDVGKFVGIFAAIGLALGAIGSVLASIVSGFLGLVWWKMPFAVIGIILVISGPSMVLAYLKLRKRNLAPILDANGWAINANVIVNIAFGNTLTHLANLPSGAKINLNDPFTKKKRPFLPVLLLLCVIAGIVFYYLWKNGLIHIHF
jgi:hypothetical protein